MPPKRIVVAVDVRTLVRAHTHASFDVRVVEQPAAEAILDATPAADLVVMGTHGRHNVVALARKCSAPVLFVPVSR